MAEPKIHYAFSPGTGYTACGWRVSRTVHATSEPHKVTCARCLGEKGVPVPYELKTHYAGPFSPRRYLCGQDAGRAQFAEPGADATCATCRRKAVAGEKTHGPDHGVGLTGVTPEGSDHV
jgi:hypothetical protein